MVMVLISYTSYRIDKTNLHHHHRVDNGLLSELRKKWYELRERLKSSKGLRSTNYEVR